MGWKLIVVPVVNADFLAVGVHLQVDAEKLRSPLAATWMS